MANTTTISGSVIQIVPDGSTDWDCQTDTPFKKVCVQSIQFNSSAVGDVCIVHDDTIDGPALFRATAQVEDGDYVKNYQPAIWCRPVIDASDCTFGTPGNCSIMIYIV